MKFHAMLFKGVQVGIQIEPETSEEAVLLGCLEGVVAEGNRRHELQAPGSLYLCPRLPWANAQSTQPDANA